MKNKLGQVKGRYITTQSSRKSNLSHLQHSQQITPNPQPIDLPLQENNIHRSRAFSNALCPLKELNDDNTSSGLKFLDYKKGKR